MSESNPIALRALYLDTAAQIDAMAARFDDVENGVTIADQLRAFAGDVRTAAEALRHPTSRAWAVMTWCEDALDPRLAYKHALDSSRCLREPGGDLVETMLRRFEVTADDPFKPKLMERLVEAARGL